VICCASCADRGTIGRRRERPATAGDQRNRSLAPARMLLSIRVMNKELVVLPSAELASVAGGFTKDQVATKLGYFAGSSGQLDGPVSIGNGSRTKTGSGYEFKFPATTGDEASVQFYKGSAIAKCPELSKIDRCKLSLSPAASNWR